jgi:hypothetical protein
MTEVHRDTDSRICGAATVVAGNSTVFVNNLLASVDKDPNNHGAGNIIASTKNVYVENELIVENGDSANPDKICPIPPHCEPSTSSGSPNVFVGS